MTLGQVAKRVRAKFLIIVSPQDHTVNYRPALEFAAATCAPVVNLESPCGHQSFNCISLGPTVARFLADPSSVHSEPCRDPSNHNNLPLHPNNSLTAFDGNRPNNT